jgi:hypothetical protein
LLRSRILEFYLHVPYTAVLYLSTGTNLHLLFAGGYGLLKCDTM